MAQAQYPYLDLTVMPEMRDYVVSPCAAILFTPGLRHVLWANGEGAQLIGAPTIRAALEGEYSSNSAMMRQVSVAADKLETSSEARANIRLKHGFQTRLLGYLVRSVTLPDGERAILFLSDSLHGRSHSRETMAKAAVQGLDGYSYAAAILEADGTILASSDQFEALALTDSDLVSLTQEVADEDDRLVKRHVKAATGNMPTGIARLADNPALHLLVVAEAEPEQAVKESEPAARTETKHGDATSHEASEPQSTEDEPPSPAAGGFSNRRERPGSNRLNRWYYKKDPEPEPVEFLAFEDVEPVQQQTSAPEPLQSESLQDEGRSQDLKDVLRPVTFSPEVTPTETAKNVRPADNSEAKPDNADFRFKASSKPVRFVWEMDGGNTFVSVSDELAEAVGPKSADILGLTWKAVGETRGLVNASDISALLEKGDTWSGKTVLWPVQNTDLRVPVDMAGLPSFDRNRAFDGFSGFGIIRAADAMIDPDGGGFNLADDGVQTTQELDDDFGYESEEVPQDGGKIVDLETRKPVRPDRELSSGEQSAFDEIAQKLSGAKLERTPEKQDADRSAESPIKRAIEPFTPSAFAKRVIEEHDAGPKGASASDDSQVDTSILARLPIPVLVYRSNDMLFGNDEFFGLTGYADLRDLAKRGGVNALFGLRDGDGNDEEAIIYHRNGSQLDVRAHLQRVPWDEQRAMLLTLRRNGGGPGDLRPLPVEDEDAIPSPVDAAPETDGVEQTPDLRPSIRDTPPISLVPEDKPETTLSPTGPLLADLDASEPEEPAEVPAPPVAEVWLDQPNGSSSKSFGNLPIEAMRGILDVATDGILILSTDGIVRALNRSAEALFDVSPEKIEGQSITKLLAPESRSVALDYLSGMSGTGVASLLNDGREIIGQTSNGGLIPLFMTVGKLENSEDCCAVVRDITHFKKAEDDLVAAKSQAESANALKSDFLSKISHEVRTPLNAIIGFSDLMIEERFGRIDNDRYRGYLRDIRRSGTHVLDLVNDLLDISKIEAGKVDLDFDACDLNNIVSETVALTQPAANKDRIIIRTSLSAVVPKVVADPRSIRQIVLNITSNAIKYTKQGGQVIVSTVYDENGEVVLRIRDTGVGMSEIELARAMKPFQQVGNVREAHRQGTGLGLPLTKALVEANRARFHIESTPDEGTLVEIHFPIQRVLADR